ncbi:MAG: efflux RND transporter periplasmic adaptor subunit [Arcicella sp.]|nr:efflux RND transporter periplasmic adaptor subunit [Arcicella sp.]
MNKLIKNSALVGEDTNHGARTIHRMEIIRKIAPIFLLLFSISCSKQTPPKEAEKEAVSDLVTLTSEQAKNANIIVGNFDQTLLSEDIKANGMVDVPPMNMASVSVPINGFVKSTTVLSGSFVKKGAVLAVLNSMEYVQMQQDYLQNLSRLKFSEQELERQTVLSQEDVGAKKKLQQAEADVSFVKASMKGLEVKLQMVGCQVDNLKKGQISSTINVHSPIDGFVKTTNLAIGKNVLPSDVLFEITGNAHKHLELKVFEKDINKIRIGQKIIIENPKFEGSEMMATVFLVGKNVDMETKSINIHAHLNSEKAEERLTVGQYVNTRILTGNRTACTLPETAIVRRGEGGFIFVQTKEKVFQQISVKLGLFEKGDIEVFIDKPIDNQKIVKSGASILQAVLSGGEEE